MYFGTLVAQARSDQENATWRRDMDASPVATESRWHSFWRGLARLVGRAQQPLTAGNQK